MTYRRKDVPLRITITSAVENHHAVIKVTDNGIGIDPQHFSRIFEVFQTLEPPDELSGTGIGLATVKKALTALGGKITLESALGLGSTFFVSLPCVQDAPSAPTP